MLTDPILSLTYFAIVLLIGLVCSVIANQLKIPNVFLLLLSGIALNNIYYKGAPLIQFPVAFTTSISILALVMIVFDSSSRLSFKEVDTFSTNALQLTGIFLVLTLIFMTFATYLFFPSSPILYALLFAALMAGTAPDVVMSMVEDTTNKIIELLKLESIINTPIIVLLPFIIIDFINTVQSQKIFDVAIEYFQPFLLQIFTGAGVGLIIAIVVFKVMRRYYSEKLSPLAVISTALVSYILAENLGGNGVLSVTVAGIIFANVTIKQKIALLEFSKLFSIILEILVFVFVGLLITIPRDPMFLMKSILLFLVYILVRFLSVQLSFNPKEANFKERIFMTLNMPKGIATAVVAALLINMAIPGLKPLLDLTLLFMLYSILLSTVVIKFSKYFLRTNIIK